MIDTKLQSLIEGLLEERNLLQAILSSPRNKNSAKKITIRPVMIKKNVVYQLSHQYEQKVIHENIATNKFLQTMMKWIPSYKQAFFYASTENYHVLLNKANEATILRKPSSPKPLKRLTHNRPKNYLLEEGKPIPFLIELGVMSSSGKIFPDKRDKFRQINRFLEMIDDIIPHLTKKPFGNSQIETGSKQLQIVDFGCGKAYLTFALYHYLHVEKKYNVMITGLDLKADVVSFCQKVADKLQFSQLRFLQGDISDYSTKEPVDMVVCLHACDTATDAALEKAVRWKATVILAVPCCQHELFKQIKCESLNPLLTHGILKERFSSLATDAARSQILEILGYKTQILEFIEMEHTPKNLLIRAIRHTHPKNRSKLIKIYHDFKELLNINPTIEQLFKIELES